MKKLFIFLAFILIGITVDAQLQDRIWVFGRPLSGSSNATMYFGNLNNPVDTIPGGQPINITSNNGNEQWAVVSDNITGALIFYTDGKNVFDHQHNLVSSLDLGADVSSAQPVAVCPVPRSDRNAFKQHFIFSNGTGAQGSSCSVGQITYRKYDAILQSFGPQMSLPGPYGTMDVTEGMKIIPCDSSADVLWLVQSLFPNPGFEYKYVVYKIHKDSISYNGAFDFGAQKKKLPAGYCSPHIELTYTNANNPYGNSSIGFASQYSSSVFTCQFDNLSGQFLTATVKSINTGYSGYNPAIYNMEFSPNGEYVYYSVYAINSGNNLYQVELADPNLTPVLIKAFSAFYAGGLKLGPDSLVYHIYDNGYHSQILRIGRIIQPDIKYIPGVTVFSQFYEENFMTFQNVWGAAFCETLIMPTASNVGISQDGLGNEEPAVNIFPNPATNHVRVFTNGTDHGAIRINLYNALGERVRSIYTESEAEQIDVSDLSRGVYVIELVTNIGTTREQLILN